MALPQNLISNPTVFAAFLAPDSTPYLALTDYEKGGTAIGNAAQGREVQDWTCFIEGTSVYAAPSTNLANRTLLFAGADITTLSIAFDSNMNVAVAFMQAGVLKLYWYDSVPGAYVTTTYAGATSGRVGTDDKRASQEGASDVIFAYVRAEALYWRQQRDRYTTEREVGPAAACLLTRVGMNALNRFQFELVEV